MSKKKFSIGRTGMPPLAFQGEILASATSRYFWNREEFRWWELAVYKADTGQYILRVRFFNRMMGEVPYQDVRVCDSATEVAHGLSKTEVYFAAARSLLGREAEKAGPAIEYQYHSLATELFEELGDEFVEKLGNQDRPSG